MCLVLKTIMRRNKRNECVTYLILINNDEMKQVV